MKVKILVLLLLSFPTLNTYAWIPYPVQRGVLRVCHLAVTKRLFRSTKDDLARLDYIEKLDGMSASFRKLKTNPDIIEGDRIIQVKMSKIDNKIYQASMPNAYGKYTDEGAHYSWIYRELNPTFRKTEISYIYIKKATKIIDEILERKDNINLLKEFLEKKSKHVDDLYSKALRGITDETSLESFIKKQQKIIRTKSIVLGKNFRAYKLIRKDLEHLIKNNKCNKKCIENVQELLNTMGVKSSSDRIRFAGILKGSKTPTIDQISKLLNSIPVAYETRAFKEMVHEIKGAARDFIFRLGGRAKFVFFLESTLGLKKTKFVQILKILDDATARVNHFPGINDIVRIDTDIKSKFYLLKENNAVYEFDEFLITFKRRMDEGASEEWKRLRTFAEKNDDDFFKRMIEAEEIALLRGDMSLHKRKSHMRSIGLILTLAGGGRYVYSFFGEDDGSENPLEKLIGELSSEEVEKVHEDLGDFSESVKDFVEQEKAANDSIPE